MSDVRAFAVISVQKSVRDKLKGIPVTDLYNGISRFATILANVLLTGVLWNSELIPSEKAFNAFSSLLALLRAITVQNNTRDSQIA